MRLVIAFNVRNFRVIFFQTVSIALGIFVLISCGFLNVIPPTGNPSQDQTDQSGVLTQTPTTYTYLPYLSSPKTNKPTSFGILVVIPGGSGSTSDSASVAAAANSGARYMRVSLDWVISEPEPGQLSFETRNDEIIQRVEEAGLRILPTLYVGRGWMNGSPPGRDEGGSRSYPPDDLKNQWSDEYGFSPSYYNFVFRFFNHYQGHFDFVAIENEANSLLFWGGSPEEYVRLIKTAYKAIKAADPNVIVVDSGFVSSTLGLCISQDYLATGLKTQEEVTEIATRYYSEETGRIKIRSFEDLERALNNPRLDEQCQRITYILENMAGSVDAVNFHFYEEYGALPVVLNWLDQKTRAAGYSPSFVTNEIGVRAPDSTYAESLEHAREVFKKMVTSQSLGLRAVVWFSADTIEAGKDKVGLFGASGEMRPAAKTFKLVIQFLNTNYRFMQTLSAGPFLYRHVFQDTRGLPYLEALWVEGNANAFTLNAPDGVTHANITDYTGGTQTLTVENGSIELILGQEPVFLVWK
jgi:hypothetical protein